ncbi:MAG: DegT/DnrJ/EryC1/StrS aminotransferase family protein [Terracidiphilus sp.]|nr:DegT/DnrJ/EryC1/StrS aminotransferase family protein [Terracidiphilus sp.]
MTVTSEVEPSSVDKIARGYSPLAKNQAVPGPWPFFAEDEIEAAVQALRSSKVNYWTGEEGRQFEKEFAVFAGCKYAIALANGSVALECALKALGVGPGDEVVTTSRTFIASASCAAMLGARPVFADVDRDSQTISAETISKVLTPRTKAIVAVHLAGWPCEMDGILALASERGIKVIEDCAQAHGATYKGRPVGSLGDVAAFSFCQDKIMTTAGEGGMVTTNSDELWNTMWSLKDHGKSYDAVYHREHVPGFRWVHESFGTNWRLSEVQSAVGRIQLGKLPRWLSVRRKYAQILTDECAAIPGLRVTVPPEYIGHAYYKYYAFVRPEVLRPEWTRDRIIEAIKAEGIRCFSGSCSEIYLEKAFPADWKPEARLPVARELGETSLMFLVHPTLSEEYIHSTCVAVEKVMSSATYAEHPFAKDSR